MIADSRDNMSRAELLAENEELRLRLRETEEVLDAIRSGEVDAIVVSGDGGEQVFSLKGAEQPYRVLVETMNEGAATIDPAGLIYYSNNRLASILDTPLQRLIGSHLGQYVADADIQSFTSLVENAAIECCRTDLNFITGAGMLLPVQVSCCPIENNGIVAISVVVTDLSQHKRNQRIFASGRLARSILKQAGESIIVCDETGRITHASRIAFRLCGKSPLWRPFDDTFPIINRLTGERYSVASPLRGEIAENLEVELTREDGQVFSLLLNSRPFTGARRGLGCIITLTDITSRREIEESLRQSEERFRILADSMPVLVWTSDTDGNIDYVNGRFHNFMGEFAGEPAEYFPYILHPDDREKTMEVWQRAMRSGEPYELEHRLRRFDGVYRWYLCRSLPVRNGEGRIVKWYGTSTDIHDLRETQEELRRSESKFRALFDSNLIALAFWNIQGVILEANQAFCALIDTTGEEIGSGKITFQQLTPPEFIHRDLEAMEEVRAKGACEPYEKELIRLRTGERVSVLIAGAFVAGSETEGIVFAVDLSKIKKMEEALRDRETRLTLAVEATAIGTFDYSPRTGRLIWSDLTRSHFGLPPQVPVDFSRFLEALHPDDRPRVKAAIEHSLTPAGKGEYRDEYRTVGLEDGRVRWVEARGKAVFNHKGEAVRLIGTTLDITERKRVEEELHLAAEDLEKRVAMRTEELARIIDTLQKEVVERMAAEKSLRQSETLLKTVLDNLPVAVWVIDRIGDTIVVNPAGRKIWEEESRRGGEEPFTYKGWRHDTGDRLAPADWGGSRAVTLGETMLDSVYDIECFDGSRKTILYSAVPLRDESGDITGAVVVNEDITARIRNEEKVLRLNRLYAVLSETDNAIVHTSDRQTLFRSICRVAVEHGGFRMAWIGLVDEAGTVRPQTSWGEETDFLDDLVMSVAEGSDRVGGTGTAIRQGSICVCNDFQRDLLTAPWHAEGEHRNFKSMAAIPLKLHDRVIGSLTLYAAEKNFFDPQFVDLLRQMEVDISFALENLETEARRREAEEALKAEVAERLRAMEELRRKDRLLMQQSRLAAMGEMIGNIAHQWRQPLNTLGLIVQELPIHYDLPDFNREYLETSVAKAMRVIEHMSETIDDFRNFFKPDRAKTPFSVNDVVRKTVSLVEASFKELHLAMEVRGTEEIEIEGYPNEFSQVILNILMNSRDVFVERRTEKPGVVISIFRENGRGVVTVTDNAGGIPDDILDLIFDPYFTTKGPDKGTGVGLFMSKTIIEKNMKGRLTARNTGDGAEFRIEV